MAIKSFWLISISDHRLLVSLAVLAQQKYQTKSIGPIISASADHPDQFLNAIDQSLSKAASLASIPASEEPSHSAFILPHFWLSADGKIEKTKQKLIENVCKKLKLKPLGFIAGDEAMAEFANQEDGFPASFVLLNLDNNSASLSLVYLGKIKDRLLKNFSPPFSSSILASMLAEFKHQSNLPPQIIIQGSYQSSLVDEISHFPWTSRQPSSFLQIPQLLIYDQSKTIDIYTGIVASQIQPQNINDNQEKDDQQPESDPKPVSTEVSNEKTTLNVVSASDLGFSSQSSDSPDESPTTPVSSPKIPSIFPQSNPTPSEPVHLSDKSKISLLRLKLKKPSFNFSFSFIKKFSKQFFLLPLAFSPLLVLLPFFFMSAELTIFINPYDFKKEVEVNLDSAATSVSAAEMIIPVKKNTFTITSSVDTVTTGTKEVGDKARGEIKIFNKQSSPQKLDSNQVLTDSEGKKYYLVNPVSVSAASSDLDQGLITLGQTKASIVANDIGPEYNIASSTDLSFIDFSADLLVARTVSSLTGGSRNQISAVSTADQDLLKQKIKTTSQNLLDQEITKYEQSIPESLQVDSGRIDYSREIGEVAENITASIVNTASLFSLLPDQKLDILNSFLADSQYFSQSQIDPDLFDLKFTIEQLQENNAVATLNIQGQALPSLDTADLKNQLKGRRPSKIKQIINKYAPRAYNYNLKTNLDFLKIIPLPFNPKHITITVKTDLP